MISYSQSFLREVERFLKRSKMDATAFGKEALGDPSFVFDLRKGRSPSGRTMDKVRAWMREKLPPPSSPAPAEERVA